MFRRILEKGLNESCQDQWRELCEVLGFMRKPWGRYVGAAVIEDDGVPFEGMIDVLTATLYEQFARSDQLEATIKKNPEALGHGG